MKIKIEVFTEERSEAKRAQEGLEQFLGLVASNPHTDLATLQELALDEHESVRACVADHPKAINFMWKLVSDRSPLVRYVLASNKNLPEHIFGVLAKDEDYRIARRANRSLREIQSQDSLVGKIFSMFSSEREAS